MIASRGHDPEFPFKAVSRQVIDQLRHIVLVGIENLGARRVSRHIYQVSSATHVGLRPNVTGSFARDFHSSAFHGTSSTDLALPSVRTQTRGQGIITDVGGGRCLDASKQWVVDIHEAPGGLPVAHLAATGKIDTTTCMSATVLPYGPCTATYRISIARGLVERERIRPVYPGRTSSPNDARVPLYITSSGSRSPCWSVLLAYMS